MDDTSNIVIDIHGSSASMATDYANSGVGVSLSHIPVSKVAWGEYDDAKRASLTNPLPIQIGGQTGPIEITGFLSGSKISGGSTVDGIGMVNLEFADSTGIHYLAVSGNTVGSQPVGVSGYVQGLATGTPLWIASTGGHTSGVVIQGAMARYTQGLYEGEVTGGSAEWVSGILIQGTSAGATAQVAGEVFPGYGFGVPIAVTAGRRLGKDTDLVSVTGDVGTSRSWTNLSSTDSISVYGADATKYVRANLYGSTADDSIIGTSGDALKVAVTNGGITFSVTIADGATTVGVTNSGGPIRVQGPTGSFGDAITVRGEQSGAVDIVSTAGVAATVSGTVDINDDDIIQELTGSTGELLSRLTDIRTGTNTIQAIRTELTNGNLRTVISSIIRPDNIVSGSKTASSTAGAIHTGSALKTGVTIKNAPTGSDVLIGNRNLQTNSNQGYLLERGESIYLEISDLNKIFVRTVVGANATGTVYFVGS